MNRNACFAVVSLILVAWITCHLLTWRQIDSFRLHTVPETSSLAHSSWTQPITNLQSATDTEPISHVSELPPIRELPNRITRFVRTYMTDEQYAEWVRNSEERLAKVVERDTVDGINSEVRIRERELLERSGRLRAGMTFDRVTETMQQQPDVIELLHKESSERVTYIEWERVGGLEKVKSGMEVCFAYSPRTGVPFDGRNGQGYRVIVLMFDESHALVKWFAQQPNPLPRGAIELTPGAAEYWYGRFERSPPPPTDLAWD